MTAVIIINVYDIIKQRMQITLTISLWPNDELQDVYAIHNRKYHCKQRQQHFM